mmetsp:Transcript_16342/g.25264  ORF Transcript_16342/g.25264 Transcript_16342/m.25264 type:complete len:242 (-) Transcript_16342:350-1075(-)
MSVSWMSLSHSSSTKILLLSSLRDFSFTSWRILPGVPMTIWGAFCSFFKIFCWSLMFWPPRKHSFLTQGMNSVKRSNSFLIWLASSRVLAMIRAMPGLASSSTIWLRMAMMKTAVLPVPARAWQIMSLPSMAAGMQSCWTSEGCSKPLFLMARLSSLLSTKSLKPELLTPVNWVTLRGRSARPNLLGVTVGSILVGGIVSVVDVFVFEEVLVVIELRGLVGLIHFLVQKLVKLILRSQTPA